MVVNSGFGKINLVIITRFITHSVEHQRLMRVITLNVNGIRSAASKSLYPWLKEQKADVVCLQETRAQSQQLPPAHYHPVGYHCSYHDAKRRGLSLIHI